MAVDNTFKFILMKCHVIFPCPLNNGVQNLLKQLDIYGAVDVFENSSVVRKKPNG